MTRPGSDLRVPGGPGVPDGLVIPNAELDERFSRSSGPGGQSVNTTDSRVELRWDVQRSAALTDAQRDRLLVRLGSRLRNGCLRLTAEAQRSQTQNRAAARERLIEIVRDGLAPPPPPRRPTRPTFGSKQRRLTSKHQRAETKSGRGNLRGRPSD